MSILEYDIKNKVRNLDIESNGVVSSTKYFPVFKEEGKEKIFKPLSKTKPYSTPLFAYSEVYWSYLIKKYIDPNTPLYRIATCKNLSQEQNKYYDKGTIVNNILKEDEKLINLLELFKKYPDSVDINEYVNYCEVQYDYNTILQSKYFSKNKELGKELAKQILCSMLRRDENYHYENVNFIEKNGQIIGMAPMIDMEFSQMFMFPDDLEKHKEKFTRYDVGMGPNFSYNDNLYFESNYGIFMDRLDNESIHDELDVYKFYNLKKNIRIITKLYPSMCKEFIRRLKKMKEEVKTINLKLDEDFLGMFSSSDWKPTRMLLKDGKTENDQEYIEALEESKKNKIKLDTKGFNKRLRKEVLWSIDKLIYMLDLNLNINDTKTTIILDYNNDTLYKIDEQKKSEEEKIIEEFIKKLTNDNKY